MTTSSVRKHLARDPVMARLIKKYQLSAWPKPHQSEIFAHIIGTIIEQQLSGKAAETIFKRFTTIFRKRSQSKKKNYFPTAEEILAMPEEEIRKCGTSWAKARYIKDFALSTLDGRINLKKLPGLSDTEIIAHLTAVKGIGRWTAEMILMFTLRRPDVFSLGDLGLRTAVSKLYNVDRNNLKKIAKISAAWSPYRSLASRHLWMSLENKA